MVDRTSPDHWQVGFLGAGHHSQGWAGSEPAGILGPVPKSSRDPTVELVEPVYPRPLPSPGKSLTRKSCW